MVDGFAEGLKSLMKNNEMVDDNEAKLEGSVRIYKFFTRYVRRIHPDTYWKRAMKMNPNKLWFRLITPSDIAFVISLMKNGMPVLDQFVGLVTNPTVLRRKGGGGRLLVV